jgi:hypothetical protein
MALSRLSHAFSFFRPSNLAKSKVRAAEQDFRKACSLLELNERIVSGQTGDAGAVSLPALYSSLQIKWASEPLPKLIPFANDSMTIQLSEMFQHLHDIDAGDLLPPTIVIPAQSGELLQEPKKVDKRAERRKQNIKPPPIPLHVDPPLSSQDDADEDAAQRLRLQLQARLGFALWLGPSQAAHNCFETGVFLKGHCAPGAVLGLFPGAVYNAEMLQRAFDCGHLGDESVPRTLVPRFDESVIDAYGTLTKSAQPSPRANAFALAHHVRHPPLGVAPNVMRIQVDFLDAVGSDSATGAMPFPPHLRDYVPNSWGAEIGTGQALYSSLEQHIFCKGSVLLALRPLENEELFADLTLNPFARAAGLVPPWAKRDWV